MQIYAAARATVQQCIFATLPRHHCGRHRGRAGARRGRLGVEEEEKSHTVFIFLCIYCADRLFCVPQTTGEKSRSHRTRQPGSGARRGRLGVEEEEKSHTVFIFLCIYCADRLFCVPQTSNRHGGGEPLDRSDRPKGGRRRVNLILVSRTWGGGAVGHGAPRAGERMKSTRRQLARLQGEGGESSMKLRDWTGQGATRVRDGRRFSFWYSQTVFIFLCIDCLESNLVNFYSS